MYYENIKYLYDEAEAVFDSESYINSEESDLFMVTVSGGETYLCRKFTDEGTEGIILFSGLSSLSSIYLIEKSASENETEALLFRTGFHTFVRQKAENVPEKFIKFNLAAEIPPRDDGKIVYGYNHMPYSEVEYLEPAQVLVLKSVMKLVRTCMGCADVKPVREGVSEEEYLEGISFKYAAESWRKMLDDDYDESGSLVYRLRPSAVKELKKAQPKERRKDLVFEVDFNLVNIVREDDGETYKDIVSSVTVSDSGKSLHLNCGEHKSNLAAVLINAVLLAVTPEYYPAKIICRKMCVYLWFKNICEVMNIELEMTEELPATYSMFKRLKGSDMGYPKASCEVIV